MCSPGSSTLQNVYKNRSCEPALTFISHLISGDLLRHSFAVSNTLPNVVARPYSPCKTCQQFDHSCSARSEGDLATTRQTFDLAADHLAPLLLRTAGSCIAWLLAKPQVAASPGLEDKASASHRQVNQKSRNSKLATPLTLCFEALEASF